MLVVVASLPKPGVGDKSRHRLADSQGAVTMLSAEQWLLDSVAMASTRLAGLEDRAGFGSDSDTLPAGSLLPLVRSSRDVLAD